MTPTAETLEDVLLQAGGVLSLVADICMAPSIELSEQSRDGLARIALDAASKVDFATNVLPAAICRSLTAWGDRAACLAELKHAVETVEQHGTGRGSECDKHGPLVKSEGA